MKEIYKNMLKFYPRQFREEYAGEMEITFNAMVDECQTTKERLVLYKITFDDYLLSLVYQYILAFRNMFPERPNYVRFSNKLSLILLAPFFLSVCYNLSNQYIFNRVAPYAWLEQKTWVIYCIIMPLLALLILLLATTKSFSDRLYFNKTGQQWREVANDFIALALPFSLIVVKACM
jgi:hypothetical protein